jgi:hypothetical protein
LVIVTVYPSTVRVGEPKVGLVGRHWNARIGAL